MKSKNIKERNSNRLIMFGAIIKAATALFASLSGLVASIITPIGALVGVVSPAFIAAMQSWEGAMSNRESAILHEKP